MKKGISQEGLKLLACLTMLCDHVGYTLFSHRAEQTVVYIMLRIIGRLAFPLYAFLLAEGVAHTKNPLRYFLRLVVGAVLAEPAYDYMVYGQLSWEGQSVMVSLLLGFLALSLMGKIRNLYLKPLAALPFLVAAELFACDYGWQGAALMMLFGLSREFPYSRNTIRFGGMLVLFHMMSGIMLPLGNVYIPMQVLGALSILFISAYDGSKRTNSRAVQWAFYLFYPAHMLILAILEGLVYGGFAL